MIFNSTDPDLERAARLLAASDGDWKVVYERFPKYTLYLEAFREDSSKRRKGEWSGPRSVEATVGNQILSSISRRASKYKAANDGAYAHTHAEVNRNGNGAKPKKEKQASPQISLFEPQAPSTDRAIGQDLVEQLSDKIANQIVEKALEKALKKLAGVI